MIGAGRIVLGNHVPRWTPRWLGSGLKLWLRADAGLTLVGSAASAWADQSGNGIDWNDASNAVRRPTYGATAYSNKPGLTFNGTSNLLIPSGSSLTFGSATTLVIVAKPSPTSTAYLLASNAGNWGVISNFTTEQLEWFNGADRYSFNVASVSTLVTLVVTQTDGGALVGWTNGVQAFSQTATVALSGKSVTGLGGVAGGTNFCSSIFAEVFALNRVVSTSERQAIERYARWKYGHY